MCWLISGPNNLRFGQYPIFMMQVLLDLVDLLCLFQRMIESQDTNLEVSDHAQAPSTPGLVNEPNLFSIQEGLACDDYLDPEDQHFTDSVGIERLESASMKSDLHRVNNATDLLLACHTDCDTAEGMAMGAKENDHDSLDLIDRENMIGNLPTEVAVEGLQAKGVVRDAGTTNEVACHNGSSMALNGEHGKFIGVRCHESDTMEIGIQTEGSESCKNAAIPNSVHLLELPDAILLVSLEEAFDRPEHTDKFNDHLKDRHPGIPSKSVLQPCSTFPGVLDKSSHVINDTMLPHDMLLEDVPCTLGKDEACHPSETSHNSQGEECLITQSVQGEESQMIEPAINVDALADGQCDNVVSVENQSELDGTTTFELPALEKLLSVPQMPLDKPDGLLIESLSDKEVLEKNDGARSGAKISGNKRTCTDSIRCV